MTRDPLLPEDRLPASSPAALSSTGAARPGEDASNARPGSPPRGKILPFRPRPVPHPAARPAAAPPPVAGLERYHAAPEEPDEYRRRMLANILGLAMTAGLVAGGLWIADVMAHIRKDQDCVLIGRKNCAPVAVPPAIAQQQPAR